MAQPTPTVIDGMWQVPGSGVSAPGPSAGELFVGALAHLTGAADLSCALDGRDVGPTGDFINGTYNDAAETGQKLLSGTLKASGTVAGIVTAPMAVASGSGGGFAQFADDGVGAASFGVSDGLKVKAIDAGYNAVNLTKGWFSFTPTSAAPATKAGLGGLGARTVYEVGKRLNEE